MTGPSPRPVAACRQRGERGQVTVMIIGFFVLAGLVVAMAVDASAAYLAQRRIADLADGAALAASEGVSRSTLYAAGEVVAIDPAAARSAVAAYLEDAGATRTGNLRGWNVVADDGAVRVRLSGVARLPLVPPGWDGTREVQAEAVVELRIR